MIRTLLALLLFAGSSTVDAQAAEEPTNHPADADAPEQPAESDAEESAAEEDAPAESFAAEESAAEEPAADSEQAAEEDAPAESDAAEAAPHRSTTELIRAPADDEQAAEDEHDWRFVGALSIHGSLLSSVAGRSTLDLTYGAALRFGARRGSNQLDFVADYSGWQSLEDRSVITFGTLNLAAEYTRTFFSDVIAVSLAAGPSILLTDTLLDDAGSVGLFVELRPAGFRWRMKHVNIGLDPLSFTLVAPVLGALPLVRVQYRTTLTVEFRP
ncbi:MAG: hypothetical protein AB8H86_21320 [Polyangiales bacterium]